MEGCIQLLGSALIWKKENFPQRFERIKVLGEGAMGRVYRAWDKDTQRWIALKVLLLEKIEEDSWRKRMIREAKLCARLDHANVVSVYDVLQQEQRPCIVMEYVEGSSFREILSERRVNVPLLDIFKGICSALEHAHDKGIIHRDLKPENILLKMDAMKIADWQRAVKVGDWGISRCLDDEEGLTKTGFILGTPEYMAPERICQEGPSGPASDLYSLGCMLYEIEVGRPPFVSKNKMDLLQRHLKEKVTIPPLLSPDKARLIQRLLAKDPEQRLHSAEELAQSLDELTDSPKSGGTVISSKAALPPRAPSRSPSGIVRKTLAATLSFLALAILLNAAYLQVTSRENLPEAGRESSEIPPFYRGLENGSSRAKEELLDLIKQSKTNLPAFQELNSALALSSLEKGAEKGKANSLYLLAHCYLEGVLLERDPYKGAQLLEEAMDAGSSDALISLARCCEDGLGVKENYYRAKRLYSLASKRGNPEGTARVGTCLERGYIMDENPSLAFKKYKEAAQMGSPYGLYRLGRCFERGTGTKPDLEKAVECYQKAAMAGNGEAAADLGKAYADKELGLPQSDEKAFENFKLGRKLGDVDAWTELAWCYEVGVGVDEDPERATKEYLEIFSRYGDETAAYRLGLCYQSGRGVEKNEIKAFEYYRHAAKAGSNGARLCLIECYKKGFGCKRDEEKAEKLIAALDSKYWDIVFTELDQ